MEVSGQLHAPAALSPRKYNGIIYSFCTDSDLFFCFVQPKHSLYSVKHYSVKADGRVEVEIHTFLTWALHEGD
jgi:hypothetical protein